MAEDVDRQESEISVSWLRNKSDKICIPQESIGVSFYLEVFQGIINFHMKAL